ncbi:MAG TPA: DNA polymerase III subunit delta' C-terminal domain-containing protein, partial [Phycisphaerae bacterium]|nr:DNA polymerase III subunit delta' C-terminal domain-containing protein [Phycisphaerae bacterium]
SKIADSLADAQVGVVKKEANANLSKNLAMRQVTGIMLRLIAGAFADALTLATGSTPPLMHADQSQEIQRIAKNHRAADLAMIIERLSEYERLLWRNVNAKTVWDNAAISCSAGVGNITAEIFK